jgi:hypothetical protein
MGIKWVIIGCLSITTIIVGFLALDHGRDEQHPHRSETGIPIQPEQTTPTFRDYPHITSAASPETSDHPPSIPGLKMPTHDPIGTGPDSTIDNHHARSVLMEINAGDTERNDAINFLRLHQDPSLTMDLITIIRRPNERPRFRAFAAQFLGSIVCERDTDASLRLLANETLHELLFDRDRAVRRESLRSLTINKDPTVLSIIDAGLTDTAWAQDRDLIIQCLYELHRIDMMCEVRRFLSDSDPIVQIESLYVLGEWHDMNSRDAFIQATTSSNPRIRRAGALALSKVDAHLDDP